MQRKNRSHLCSYGLLTDENGNFSQKTRHTFQWRTKHRKQAPERSAPPTRGRPSAPGPRGRPGAAAPLTGPLRHLSEPLCSLPANTPSPSPSAPGSGSPWTPLRGPGRLTSSLILRLPLREMSCKNEMKQCPHGAWAERRPPASQRTASRLVTSGLTGRDRGSLVPCFVPE